MKYPRVTLLPGRDRSIAKLHPWVFSGAISDVEGQVADGSVVDVFSSTNTFLGVGHYFEGNIAIKLFSFSPVADLADFFNQALTQARALRTTLGLIDNSNTNAYRLVNGEGDSLPGLLIDIYGRTAVIQAQSSGMFLAREQIASALLRTFGKELQSIIDRSSRFHSRATNTNQESHPDGSNNKEQESPPTSEFLFGSTAESTIVEGGITYQVDLAQGQKTGFYLDQRENRALLRRYAPGCRVLDAFSHTGAFALNALAGQATEVVCVDASKPGLELATRNITQNYPRAQFQTELKDCFHYLEQSTGNFNVIILDPPAFVKHEKGLKRGLRGYESINMLALKTLARNGILFTFSCSQLVSREMFQDSVLCASRQVKRKVSILHQLSQAPCHPVSIYHPEGAYLKGLVLVVQ